eukprot:gene8430-biopygen11779
MYEGFTPHGQTHSHLQRGQQTSGFSPRFGAPTSGGGAPPGFPYCNGPEVIVVLGECRKASPRLCGCQGPRRAASPEDVDECCDRLRGACREACSTATPTPAAGPDDTVPVTIDASQRAADPVPPSADTRRLLCPIANCPYGDASRAPVWEAHRSGRGLPQELRSHINDHLSGAGGACRAQPPREWLQLHRHAVCVECHHLVQGPDGTQHPRCRARLLRRQTVPVPALHPEAFVAPEMSDAQVVARLPTLEEIARNKTTTLEGVPPEMWALWARCMTQAVSAVLVLPDPSLWDGDSSAALRSRRAWVELIMMPKAVLCRPPRAGKKHKRESQLFIRHRLERWLEGSHARLQLWEDISKPRRTANRKNDSNPKEKQQKRAIALTQEGRYHDALRTLTAPAAVECTEKNVRILESKHPAPSRPPLREEEPPIPPTTKFPCEEVCKNIRAFPKGSAGGPCGLRPQHLKDAIRPTLTACAAEPVAALINILGAGRAPWALAPTQAGARLAALPKDDDDLRPIA